MHTAWTPEVRKNMDYQSIVNYFTDNNIKPDFGLVFVGMCSNVNIKGFLKKKDGTDYSPLICFQNYTAPILYALNKLGCPVYTLAEDARYMVHSASGIRASGIPIVCTIWNVEFARRRALGLARPTSSAARIHSLRAMKRGSSPPSSILAR